MLSTALWVLDHEVKFIRGQTSGWPAFDDKPGVYVTLGVMAAIQTAAIAQLPYHSLYRAQAAAEWAVADISYTRAMAARHGSQAAKYRTMTYWDWWPRTRAFASRSGARFVATKVAARALGPIGVALLMVDAWHTGIWIGEKLFGEMD